MNTSSTYILTNSFLDDEARKSKKKIDYKSMHLNI